MSWQTAVVAAIGAAQFQQQGALGKYNQAVNNRNAEVLEQQAETIDNQVNFDLAQFDKEFRKIEGETKVNLAKSGVVQGSGTAWKIQASNKREAELQKEIIKYNAQIKKSQAIEKANFAIISGNIAKEQSRLAQIRTVSQTGTSLLTMNT
jgi:valyl-tRNA synthetase